MFVSESEASPGDDDFVVHSGQYKFELAQNSKAHLIQGQAFPRCGSNAQPISARVIPTHMMSEFLATEGTVLHLIHNKPHPCLPKLRDTVETESLNFIVMDSIDTDLVSHIRSRGWLPEEEALRLFRQLVSAVAHLHKHKIVLGCLRPEHVMFADSTKSNILIADISGAEVIRVSCAKSTNKCAADMHGLGAILYMMLTGRSARLRFSVVDTPQPISESTRQLVWQLLDKDVLARPTADDVLETISIPSPTISQKQQHPQQQQQQQPQQLPNQQQPTPQQQQQQRSTCPVILQGEVCRNSSCQFTASTSSVPMYDTDCDQIVPDMTSCASQVPTKRKRPRATHVRPTGGTYSAPRLCRSSSLASTSTSGTRSRSRSSLSNATKRRASSSNVDTRQSARRQSQHHSSNANTQHTQHQHHHHHHQQQQQHHHHQQHQQPNPHEDATIIQTCYALLGDLKRDSRSPTTTKRSRTTMSQQQQHHLHQQQQQQQHEHEQQLQHHQHLLQQLHHYGQQAHCDYVSRAQPQPQPQQFAQGFIIEDFLQRQQFPSAGLATI